MKQVIKFKSLFGMILMVTTLLISSCLLDITEVHQPETGYTNNKVVTTIRADFTQTGSAYYTLSILMPVDWEIANNEIYYRLSSSEQIYSITYNAINSANITNEQETPQGYYWWSGISSSNSVVTGEKAVAYVVFNTGNTAGNYNLRYHIGESQNQQLSQFTSGDKPITLTTSPQTAVLSSGRVFPELNSNPWDVHSFEVMYNSPSRTIPTTSKLYLDDVAYDMELVAGSYHNGKYGVDFDLIEKGFHEYYFLFDNTLRYPEGTANLEFTINDYDVYPIPLTETFEINSPSWNDWALQGDWQMTGPEGFNGDPDTAYEGDIIIGTKIVYEFMTYPLDELIKLDLNGSLGVSKEERREAIFSILKEAEQRTNEEMIGTIPEEVKIKRERIAGIIAALIILTFAFTLWRVWKILTPEARVRTKKNNKYLFYITILLAPAVISILMWKYIPMISGSLMAVQDFKLVGDSQFIGVGNLAEVLFDPTWWASVGRTLYYMSLSLGLGFFPPIILAILLQEVSHGKLFYRVIYYLPAVISGVIVIYLWKLLYSPSDSGVLNQILMSIGLPKSMWIRDESIAMLCVVLPGIWAGMGPGSLIYLAALKNIPNDMYEAADIDGAGFFAKVWHIVLPSLKGLIIIQFIAAFIIAAQSSDFILIMTFGGPNEATRVADLLIFEKAYLYLKFGLATTMAWLLSLLMMGFTILQIKYISKMEFRTAKGDDK